MENLKERIEKLSDKQRQLMLNMIQLRLEAKDNEASNQGSRLVAYFTAEQNIDEPNLRQYLKERLPDYMMPSSFMQLEEMPRLPNGKINIKGLRDLKGEKPTEEISGYVAPRNPVEEQLVKIWEEVLGFSPIGVYDNFFEIGGDSILSIQINGKARKLGYRFLPNQLFDEQTIANLALTIKTEKQKVEEHTMYAGPVKLTPIQQWFFEEHKNEPHHWNQGLFFNLPVGLNTDHVKTAVEKLIARYDALRLSFVSLKETWKASILKADQIKAFQYIDLSDLPETEQNYKIEQVVLATQAEFKLAEGALFQCIYFHGGTVKNDRLVLLAHHLLVDNISWQIIIQDFSTIISQLKEDKEVSLAASTISYKKWSDSLYDIVRTDKFKEDYPYWKSMLEQAPDTFPLDFNTVLPIKESTVEYIIFHLDATRTNLLLKEVSAAFHVKVHEALITALLIAMRSFNKITKLHLGLEGHGRDAVYSDNDFFGSVGWFTSFYPLILSLKPEEDISTTLNRVKEQIRSIPNKGLSYGVLRYLYDDYAMREKLAQQPPVIFNYLGVQKSLQTDVLGVGQNITQGIRSEESERYHLLEFNIVVKNQKLEVNCGYSKDIYRSETIEQLMEEFKKAIDQLINHSSSTDDYSYIPSDFPEVDISEDDLSNLFDQI